MCMNEHDIGVRTATPAAWTFFRQWLRHPLSTASVTPSGRQLTRAMMRQLPADARCVVELGAGTGVFTRALLEHGIAPGQLVVVELNAELHALLSRQLPRVAVVHGDARDLRDIVARVGCGTTVDAVVSGLGLLAMPRAVQQQILTAVFDVLGPGRSLIQFTYSPAPPVATGLLQELDLRAERVAFAPLNLPPAFVFKFSRCHG